MSAMDHALVALAWLSFGFGHSVLTTPTAQVCLSRLFGRWSRIVYNLIAAIHLAAVLWVGERWVSASNLGGLAEAGLWFDGARLVLAGAGALLLVIAAREYDLGRFSGMAQLRGAATGDEPLLVKGVHRYMRHPLYLGAMMILWARAETDAQLATAVWTSTYFYIGAFFEERKLVRLYGQAYCDYQRETPAFLPWRRGGSV